MIPDPYEPPTLPPPNPDDPLSAFNDDSLGALFITLKVACGRNRSTLRTKNRKRLCDLAQVLGPEFDKRGKSPPSPPYSA